MLFISYAQRVPSSLPLWFSLPSLSQRVESKFRDSVAVCVSYQCTCWALLIPAVVCENLPLTISVVPFTCSDAKQFYRNCIYQCACIVPPECASRPLNRTYICEGVCVSVPLVSRFQHIMKCAGHTQEMGPSLWGYCSPGNCLTVTPCSYAGVLGVFIIVLQLILILYTRTLLPNVLICGNMLLCQFIRCASFTTFQMPHNAALPQLIITASQHSSIYFALNALITFHSPIGFFHYSQPLSHNDFADFQYILVV